MVSTTWQGCNMSLVTNRKGSLFNGVNQQPAADRLASQCEVMNNCMPTIDQGLRLRNPSRHIRLVDIYGYLTQATFPKKLDSAYVYEYDRGSLGDRDSQLAFSITDRKSTLVGEVDTYVSGGLEVIDLTVSRDEVCVDHCDPTDPEDPVFVEQLTGKLYRESAGVTFEEGKETEIKDYLNSNVGKNSFAMTSIKDTTFIVNKTITPTMLPTTRELQDDDDTSPPVMFAGGVTMDLGLDPYGLNPDSVVATNDTDFVFTVPEGVTSVTVCISGGGGGGGSDRHQSDARSSGGYCGGYIDRINVTVSEGEIIPIVVGRGGNGNSNGDGSSGTGSSFTAIDNAVSVSGGGGGKSNHDNGGHKGNGGNQLTTSCGGNRKDGTRSYEDDNQYAWGGQRGMFGNGGNGGKHNNSGRAAISGGGGASFDDDADSEDGGHGRVSLSWKTILPARSDAYKSAGYIWLKSADFVGTGYTYGANLYIRDPKVYRDTHDTIVSDVHIPIPQTGAQTTGTSLAAVELAGLVDTALTIPAADPDPEIIYGAAFASESVVRITLGETGEYWDADMLEPVYYEFVAVESSDSFGDTASFGWSRKVDYDTQLPPSMKDLSAIVEVGKEEGSTYWLSHQDGKWKEFRDPVTLTQMDPATMPVMVQRIYGIDDAPDSFHVSQYRWKDRRVGDDSTNKIPSFVGYTDTYDIDVDIEYANAKIKDIFFFRNRLGFITETSIILSQVGEYANFWRTSCVAMLDGDRIDAGVESVNAVNMEYSVVLQDSVIMFADKAQFRFKGGDVLSPNSYSIVQEMSYDINHKVRPLFMNNSIFFVSRRGNFSAVYEMTISNSSAQNSNAMDVSVQCQRYIDGAIDKMTGSAVNNMLFLTSLVDYHVNVGLTYTDGEADPISPTAEVVARRNTIFTYKYHDEGNTRVQSAWSKWTFDGDVMSAFAVSDHLYLMISRVNAIVSSDWTVGTGNWVNGYEWRNYGEWIMSPDVFELEDRFERITLTPQSENRIFLDNDRTQIACDVSLGEWVYGADGNRDYRGTLKMKTVEVIASDESKLALWVYDKQRDSLRKVTSKYTLNNRKPMVYGDSRNIKVGFNNEGIGGFRMDSISLEGNLNRRATSK